jgi:hypothetical protein
MGVLHDLTVAGRRFGQVWSGRAAGHGQSFIEPSRLKSQAQRVLSEVPSGVLRAFAVIDVPANRVPWLSTTVELNAADEATWLAGGRVWLSGALDVWVGPGFALWGRIGARGPIFSGTANTHTFAAHHEGRLELGSGFPGPWSDDEGHITDPAAARAYARTSGDLAAVVLVWAGSAEQGLSRVLEICRRRLATGDDCQELAAAIEAEVVRRAEAASPPEGWRHLWHLGDSRIYGPALRDERPAIECRTCCDGGIVQKAIELPLTAGTKLGWSWCVDQLPSTLPEDTMLSHDYLSIAVEFSNGTDITYTWSDELPYETAYWCPLPDWKAKEFHVVIRSGATGLGTWVNEERDLFADYRRWMGEPPPSIVAVWLIANSLLQRNEGRVTYSDITLAGEGERLVVL